MPARATGPLLYTYVRAVTPARVRALTCACARLHLRLCVRLHSRARSCGVCARGHACARVRALTCALCAPLFVRVRARSLVCARAPSAWYLYLYLRTDGPAAPRDQTRASPAAQGRKASKRHRARATLAHALALLLPYIESGSEAGFQIPAREIALGGDPPPTTSSTSTRASRSTTSALRARACSCTTTWCCTSSPRSPQYRDSIYNK